MRMKEYAKDAIESGWISSIGNYQSSFGNSLSKYYDGLHCVTCSSGTTALHLALEALGITGGDEVIVPDVSFVATVNCVLHSNATPIIAPVDAGTGNLDPSYLPDLISDRTKAIIVTHLYSIPCQIEAIRDFCTEYSLHLIEDCAESFASTSSPGGKLLGTYGDASCFSFYGNKIVSCGEGGAVLFKNYKHAERAQQLRDHGMSKVEKYKHLFKAYNYRMTNIQAALGYAQMVDLQDILLKRLGLLAKYNDALCGSKFQVLPDQAGVIPWLIYITHISHKKDPYYYRSLASFLESKKIETRPIFRPFHSFDYLKPYIKANLSYEASYLFCDSYICLPTYLELSMNSIDFIADKILSF
jgi:perosamine synthetase